MINSIVGVAIPLVQLYIMWRIYKLLKTIADAEDRKKELADMVRKFGAMFAAAAEIPKPPGKKKVVTFEANEE